MMSSIEEELIDCEYPYKWQLRERLKNVSCRILEDLTITLDESSLLEVELPFNSLMIYVALAYEYYLSNDIIKGLEILRDGEAKFRSLLENENAQTLSSAFSHVMKASEIFLLKQKGDVESASKIISSIPKVSEMNVSNKTALQYGFPALFVVNFSVDGINEALNCLTKAIEEDPTESVWYYIKVDCIGKLGRAERLVVKMPSDEELQLMEKALEIKRAAIYTSFSAALYRQCSKELNRRILSSRFKNEPRIKELNEKSWKLYKESIELNPNCPETLLRCARGFLFLPPPFQDVSYAKELLDKAFVIAPHSRFGHHVMAEYYKMIKDPENAMKYLKICEKKKLFGATMALIRLEYQLKVEVDFIERLEKLLDDYDRDLDRAQIFSEIITYYLLVLNELRKACEYADKLMDFGKIGDFVLQCRPSGAFCTSGFQKETLYELLTYKIGQVKECSLKERNYYDEFIKRLRQREIASVKPEGEKETTFSACASSWRTKSYRNTELNNSDNNNSNNVNWRNGPVRNSTAFSFSKQPLSWRRENAGPSLARQNPGANNNGVANYRAVGAWGRNSTGEQVDDIANKFGRIKVQNNTYRPASDSDVRYLSRRW